MLDPKTPEGIRNLVLAKTGDSGLAEHAMTEAMVQLKLARIGAGL